jgi:hypothetical protein
MSLRQGPLDRRPLGFFAARFDILDHVETAGDAVFCDPPPRKTRLKGIVMKANKALKRLARIEGLMSNLTGRYSASAPGVRDVLQNAMAAVTRAKEAVGLEASSAASKNPPVHSEAIRIASPEIPKPKRKLSAAGRKAIIAATKKRWALKKAEAARLNPPKTAAPKKAAVKKIAPARAAKKSAPGKNPTVKEAAAKKTVLAPAQPGT